jgi:arylsulfatase A-like enzyme
VELGLMDDGVIPDSIQTLPQILSHHGYYTTGLTGNDTFLNKGSGITRLFQEFHVLRGSGSRQLLLPFHTLIASPRYLTELAYQFGFISMEAFGGSWRGLNREATRLFDNHRSTPLFLYLHYLEPHSPYYCIPYHGPILDIAKLKLAYQQDNPWNMKLPQGKSLLSASETNQDRYQEGVQTADRAVADLLEELKRCGLNRNSIIIIMADHGEAFTEHQMFGHGNTVYNEETNIPLIIYSPPDLALTLPHHAAGISSLDVGPTVLDMAGISEKIKDTCGGSLLRPDSLKSRQLFSMVQTRGTFWCCAITEPYKLIIRKYLKEGFQDTLLFNLETDRNEKINLYPQLKAVADSIAPALQWYLKKYTPLNGGHRWPRSPGEIQRLKALGYVN